MRVLLVEDDVLLAKSVVGLLELSGAEVVHKADAKGAEEALATSSFGLLITDYSLGAGPHGDEVLKAAQRLQPTTKRIMMSGTKAAEWVVEAGLAQAFYLKTSSVAGILLEEVEALNKQALDI
jgi:DNA-binding NtrC family response regulator